MKKRGLKKLSLHRETLVTLAAGRLAHLRGGRALAGTADFETCEGCDSYYDRCPAKEVKPVDAIA